MQDEYSAEGSAFKIGRQPMATLDDVIKHAVDQTRLVYRLVPNSYTFEALNAILTVQKRLTAPVRRYEDETSFGAPEEN